MSRQLTVFDPFRMWDQDMFDRPFRRMLNNWVDMPVDVSEDADNVNVKISVPGFNKENIDIHIEDMVLTVTGRSDEQKEENDKKQKFYRKEISSQSFTQSIALPNKVESEKAKANFKDGILTISLPKAAEVKPKKIEISVE
jgi:HSP20 family protein